MILTTFWFLIIFNKSKVLASCSFPPQISHQNCYPKSTKIQNNKKNHDLWKSRSRARGVAKTVFGVPMLHGKHFFFDRHAAWECDLCLLRHLHSENAIFSFLPHVPSEKLENHEHRILESCCGRVGAKDAKSKSPPKSILPLASTNGTLFLTSAKIQLVYKELCIFPKEYT